MLARIEDQAIAVGEISRVAERDERIVDRKLAKSGREQRQDDQCDDRPGHYDRALRRQFRRRDGHTFGHAADCKSAAAAKRDGPADSMRLVEPSIPRGDEALIVVKQSGA
jgi:hypothetical protein